MRNPDDETPMECTGSENDVVMIRLPRNIRRAAQRRLRYEMVT
jgi:hypothetical protein